MTPTNDVLGSGLTTPRSSVIACSNKAVQDMPERISGGSAEALIPSTNGDDAMYSLDAMCVFLTGLSSLLRSDITQGFSPFDRVGAPTVGQSMPSPFFGNRVHIYVRGGAAVVARGGRPLVAGGKLQCWAQTVGRAERSELDRWVDAAEEYYLQPIQRG